MSNPALAYQIYSDFTEMFGLGEMIVDERFDGVKMYLGHADTGEPVHYNETVESSRNDEYLISGGHAPKHESSSGRVFVCRADPDYTSELTYFPHVFDLKWFPLPDQGTL